MASSGTCPACGDEIALHDNAERKTCHDFLSGYQRVRVNACQTDARAPKARRALNAVVAAVVDRDRAEHRTEP